MAEPVKEGAQPEVQDFKKVEHKSIYQALSAFQGEMKAIEKTAKVSFKEKNSERMVEYTYAPLGDTMEYINPYLGKHGLSVRWEIDKEKGIDCILTHETTDETLETVKSHEVKGVGEDKSQNHKTEEKDVVVKGELRSGFLALDLTNPDMKVVGGQITYGRRYTLGIVTGIATDEDKDTEIMEASKKNTENFAVKQVKDQIAKADTVEAIDKQLTFLKKELDMAKAVETGTAQHPPSLGLKAPQYEELIKTAEDVKAKVEGKTVAHGAGGAKPANDKKE